MPVEGLRKKYKMKAKETKGCVALEENLPRNDHNVDPVNERKKKKKRRREDCMEQQEKYSNDTLDCRTRADSMDTTPVYADKIEEMTNSKMKKKEEKNRHNDGDGAAGNEVERKKGFKNRRKDKQQTKIDDSGKAKIKKKVRFSSEVEIFPIPVDSNDKVGMDDEDKLVRGKRFTREEDEIIKRAVSDYVTEHELGEKGLEMVLNSKNHPEVKGCWKEIGSAIPYRPYLAVYYRAQVLFRRSDNRKWSQEEYEMVLSHQKEHGNQWKELAEELGRHRFHVKDTWRRIKLQNVKRGHWSQQEYQKLFDLVNVDLQKKVSEEKRSKHGMLRDNICWTAISDELSTRGQATCCLKWYRQLTSPLVDEGLWVDTDDYRLLMALYNLDSTCMEDVDWDDLVEERSGEICRRRWNQMVLHIGHHGNKSFSEQVEVLAKRYCPDLLEARIEWDSKPRVP